MLDPFERKEDIRNILDKAEVSSVISCCDVPNKYCSNDTWKGNMESLIKLVFRLGIENERQKHIPI